jgi:alpha-amylase
VRGVETDLKNFALRDEWQQLEAGFSLAEAGNFYFFPLETVSQSECGLERVHQGSVVLAAWPLRLEPGATVQRVFDFYVKKMNS